MKHRNEAARWILRLLLAGAAAVLTSIGILRATDLVTLAYPPIQIDALRVMNGTFDSASAAARHPLELAFFGDSLSATEHVKRTLHSTPERLADDLGAALSRAKVGDRRSIQLTRLNYSGLSLWSYYYLTDRLIDFHPDLAVLEFNLYNFSAAWRHHDRKILAAVLGVRRFPQTMTLPLSAAGFATDEWLFHHLLLVDGWLPVWEAVQREQARCAEAYWILSDEAGQIVSSPRFTLRVMNRLIEMRERFGNTNSQPGGPRSTAYYARHLLGKTLTGVEKDDAALRMLEATLSLLQSAGVRTLVYIPPYNMDHLRALGVVQTSHFGETIARVGEVTRERGAEFLDLHAIFPDAYFRDQMDHLSEEARTDGHEVVAKRLAAALDVESKRIVAEHR